MVFVCVNLDASDDFRSKKKRVGSSLLLLLFFFSLPLSAFFFLVLRLFFGVYQNVFFFCFCLSFFFTYAEEGRPFIKTVRRRRRQNYNYRPTLVCISYFLVSRRGVLTYSWVLTHGLNDAFFFLKRVCCAFKNFSR